MARQIPTLKALVTTLGPVSSNPEDLKQLYEHLVAWRAHAGGITARSILEEANALMDAHGIEYLRPEDEDSDNWRNERGAYYVNTGDAYTPTLLIDLKKDRFIATDYGSFVEAEERKGRRFI